MESTQSDASPGGRQPYGKSGADTPTNGQQQELLNFLFECESLAQEMVSSAPSNALMEHAVGLCEGYLKTMLDMHQVWLRLQQAQALGSDLKIQLEKMQSVLQDVSRQASRNAHRDQSKAAQARYWNTVGGLIDEVLRLPRQQDARKNHQPEQTPLPLRRRNPPQPRPVGKPPRRRTCN